MNKAQFFQLPEGDIAISTKRGIAALILRDEDGDDLVMRSKLSIPDEEKAISESIRKHPELTLRPVESPSSSVEEFEKLKELLIRYGQALAHWQTSEYYYPKGETGRMADLRREFEPLEAKIKAMLQAQ